MRRRKWPEHSESSDISAGRDTHQKIDSALTGTSKNKEPPAVYRRQVTQEEEKKSTNRRRFGARRGTSNPRTTLFHLDFIQVKNADAIKFGNFILNYIKFFKMNEIIF